MLSKYTGSVAVRVKMRKENHKDLDLKQKRDLQQEKNQFMLIGVARVREMNYGNDLLNKALESKDEIE